jgi:ABC-2 type transport system permease protein
VDQQRRVARARHALRKYGSIMRLALIERLTHRGDFLLRWIIELVSMATSILLWEAIFQGASQESLSGFNSRHMIAYILLIHVGRLFGMTGLALRFAHEIRDGTLKRYLLQPVDLVFYHLAYWTGYRLAFIAISSLPYCIVVLICCEYLDGFPQPSTLAAYVASLLLGYLVSFFFEAIMGLSGFWLLEVTGFVYSVNAVTFFVSGQMLPLDLLPAPWEGMLKALPFQYAGYFPAMVFLGRVQGKELWYGLLVELTWALVFIGITRWLLRRGLQRYSAYGG